MHVDVAIIGGGVAGLATALSLRQRGLDAVAFERAPAHNPAAGLGFLLMPNGIDALTKLGLIDKVRAVSHSAQRAVHRSPAGELQRDAVIPEHLGLLRGPFLEVLLRALPTAAVRTGMAFTGFDQSGSCRRANFKNGEQVTARVFVGADGIDSQIRQGAFGTCRKETTPVQELVAIVPEPTLSDRYAGWLYKVEDRPRRQTFGLFSVGGNELLWYLRWDRRDQDLTDPTPEAMRAFVANLTVGWPQPTARLVECTDFNKAAVVGSVLVEMPPSFTFDNVVLIGDAAHPLVRLTTQGVNSALVDSVTLAELLAQDTGPIEETLQHFSATRRPTMRDVQEDGRRKIDAFLQLEAAPSTQSFPTDHRAETDSAKLSGALGKSMPGGDSPRTRKKRRSNGSSVRSVHR